MNGFHANLEQLSLANEDFRHVLYTAKHSQLVLMALQPNQDIGEEVHQLDQFFRIESGSGIAELDGKRIEIEDGTGLVVPAGTRHNLINTSPDKLLKLYTIYSPPEHKDQTIRSTKEEAERLHEHFDGMTTEA